MNLTRSTQGRGAPEQRRDDFSNFVCVPSLSVVIPARSESRDPGKGREEQAPIHPLRACICLYSPWLNINLVRFFHRGSRALQSLRLYSGRPAHSLIQKCKRWKFFFYSVWCIQTAAINIIMTERERERGREEEKERGREKERELEQEGAEAEVIKE